MRWKKPRSTSDWHPWFAWHPVKTECGTWVWLEYVMRKDHNWYSAFWWRYTLPTNRIVD